MKEKHREILCDKVAELGAESPTRPDTLMVVLVNAALDIAVHLERLADHLETIAEVVTHTSVPTHDSSRPLE